MFLRKTKQKATRIKNKIKITIKNKKTKSAESAISRYTMRRAIRKTQSKEGINF
jgi:hypothetical protein